jgi:O-antigen biosynthesis protein
MPRTIARRRRSVGSSPLRRLMAKLPEPQNSASAPARVMDIELSEPLPTLTPDGFATAHVLVMLHGQPLGTVEVSLHSGPVRPRFLMDLVRSELGEALEAHRRRDGLDDALRLTGPEQTPQCLRDLEPPVPPPVVSVVVATRNRSEQLARCLESVLRVTYPAFDVIVVDNAPSDESTQQLVKKRFGSDTRVRYVREEVAGVSRARNLGARVGAGEFVAFTDDDAVVHPLWLNALVAAFGENPSIACATGLTLPGSLETPAERAFELYGSMALGYRRRVYDLGENRADSRLYPYTAGIFGASNNCAFRREPFLQRGGFDPLLGPATPAFGAEDLDVFLALILDGQMIAYEPRAMVRHEHRSDFQELYWQVFTYSAGFTALLTKWAITDRAVARDLIRRVPALLPAALVHSHRDAAGGEGEYSAQLRWLERVGFLYGPVAYLRSRWRFR